MTLNVNPNSRAAFVDRSGRLTKYGHDVLTQVFSVLNLLGGGSIIEDLEVEGAGLDLSSLKSRISRVENVAFNIQNDIPARAKKPEQQIPDDSCLLYTSPSPRDLSTSRMPSSA